MKSNFHTHTYRCHHAIGLDREYVLKAIEIGLKVLGFSDHSPYYFPDGYYSGFRMKPDEIEGYVNSLKELREEFKDKIKIYIGYEMEYYPKYFDRTIEMISEYDWDYIILGQHFIYNEIGQIHNTKPIKEEGMLKDYVDTLIDAIKTDMYFFIAHPDVFNFVGDMDLYKKEMERLCIFAKESNTPLEYNLLGLRTNRFYPRKEFWEVASRIGNEVILGCDAHDPKDIALKNDISLAKKNLKELGLKIIEPMKPKQPKQK